MDPIGLFIACMSLLWLVVAVVAGQTLPDLLRQHREFQKSIANTQNQYED